jgi:hypothetical protein
MSTNEPVALTGESFSNLMAGDAGSITGSAHASPGEAAVDDDRHSFKREVICGVMVWRRYWWPHHHPHHHTDGFAPPYQREGLACCKNLSGIFVVSSISSE